MQLIDDEGNLLGAVNIIDALVVVLVLAVAIAGVALVSGDESKEPTPGESAPKTVESGMTVEIVGVQPYVADAIPSGPVDANGIVAVENKSVDPTMVVTQDDSGKLHEYPHPQKRTVTLRLAVNATVVDDEPTFQEKPIEVGQSYTLDFGDVSVNGTVVQLESND